MSILKGYKYGRNCTFSGFRTRLKWKIHPTVVLGHDVTLKGGDVTISKGVTIGSYVIINTRGGKFVMGENSSINEFSKISCLGGVLIGNNVRLGSHLNIVASNHNFDDIEKPISHQGLSSKGIIIESDVWVGCNVVILDGVTLGSGSIIAAGAVVTKNVPSGSICAGVPARIIKNRW